MSRKIIALTFLISAMLLGGCIKEDVGPCPTALRLYFRHTINEENTDLIEDRIGHIRVYVFDRTTGLLHDIIDVGKDDIIRGWINVDLPEGTYTFSGWAGASDDLMQNGYMDAEMTDPVNAVYTPGAGIGSATLDTFRMLLESEAIMPDMDMPHPGEITPVDKDFDDFFHAMADSVRVVARENRTAELDFLRNSNILNVKISGLQHMPGGMDMAPFDMDMEPNAPFVCIAGHNGRYGFNNRMGEYAREVCYEPLTSSVDDTEMNITLKALRLDIFRCDSQPVLLHVRSMDTGEDLIPPVDIVNNVILKAMDEQGNPVWPDQDAIDRETEFPIELSFSAGGGVTVLVNGFEVFNTEANIERD